MEKEEKIKDFYTVNEFAKLLRVHPNTIRRAINKDQIKTIKFGNDLRNTHRIPHSEIERCILKDLREIIKKQIEEDRKFQ